MAKATARWSGHKVKFDIESASGHTAAIDEAPVFGDDEAMRPTEMLLGALAGCTGMNAVLLLKKFKQLEITFVTAWDGKHDKESVEKAIDLACNRYCPIHATLSHGTKIEHRHKDTH